MKCIDGYNLFDGVRLYAPIFNIESFLFSISSFKPILGIVSNGLSTFIDYLHVI